MEFSEPLIKTGPVHDGWATWSSPPFSEDPNPFVLIAATNVLEMVLSQPVAIFGFAMETSPNATVEFTDEFLNVKKHV